MVNLSNKDNEWLMVELKVCRAVLGISQMDIAVFADVSPQAVKRIENNKTNPRIATVRRIRETINFLGVEMHVDENGLLTQKLAPKLVEALNKGRLKEYVYERTEAKAKILLESDRL